MNPNVKVSPAFQREYSNLNAQQKQAVDLIEGPVLVLAGPGTGKTQILTIRIGNILINTDTDPKNILCLTYTESGASNMRRRLLEFIGPTAYEVSISTFHSFCNTVIRENPEYFLEYSNYSVVSDLEKNRILLNIFEGLQKDHLLYRFKGVYKKELSDAKIYFEQIKKENWNPEQLLADIDQYLIEKKEAPEFIYGRKTGDFKKGDFNPKKYLEFVKKFDRSRAFIQLYPQYQEALDEMERYEYEDMIRWVIEKFNSDEDLLAKYQERYQYILVDEYQDTNGAQNQILFTLLNYFDKPNVFAVGDDDQAIFRFQGANVQNMFDFEKLYSPQKIVLSNNYRSSQIILDAAASVIENNQERLVNKDDSLSKILRASGQHSQVKSRPGFIKFETQNAEVILTCQKIKALLEKGVAPNQIAILYRKNLEAEPYAKWFSANNIPFQISKQTDVLSEPFLIHLINILKYFVKNTEHPFEQDGLLYKILHAPYIEIGIADIGRLAWHQRTLRTKAAEDSRDVPGLSLIELLSQPDQLSLARISSVEICQKLIFSLSELQKQIFDFTPQVFLEKILIEFNILDFILQQEDKLNYLQILNSFFEFVKSESQKNPRMTVPDLIQLIEEYESNTIVIPAYPLSGSSKGVVLSTLFKSKGQEYEYVFMINCSEKNWQARKSDGLKLPDEYCPPDVAEDEDARRLFYVGLTRAKFGLQLSYHASGDKNELLPSKFISEFLNSGLVEFTSEVVDDTSLTEQLILDISPVKKDFKVLEKDHFDQFLEHFFLNPTALSKYLECPVSFYYENVLQIPGARTAALGFGNAVHFALELFINKKALLATDKLEAVIPYFEKGMEKYHSHFTEREYENYKAEGIKVLPQFLNHYKEEWKLSKDLKAEQKIKTMLDDVPISGKIDRLDILNQGIRVVDYKTGNPDNSKKAKGPSDKLPFGDKYWQQMVFYGVLLKQDKKYATSTMSSCLYFIMPDSNFKFHKAEVSPEEHIPFLENLIKETYSKIKNQEFQPGCAKPECEWCSFVNSGSYLGFSLDEELDHQE